MHITARPSFPVYAGDYIGGHGLGALGTKISLPMPNQVLEPLKSLLPVNGGPGPELLSKPQPGELGPQPVKTMSAPAPSQVPVTNANQVDPLRIAIQAEQDAIKIDHTQNLVVLAALGVGGAMAIYGLAQFLKRRRRR